MVRALARNGIVTVENLRMVSPPNALLRLPGLGHTMLSEIQGVFPHADADVADLQLGPL